MTREATHYHTLEVIESASMETIKGAYKHLAQRWHPDKNGTSRAEAERKTSALNEAFRVLSDPERRREYDQLLENSRRQGDSSNADEEARVKAAAETKRRAEAEAARARAEAESRRRADAESAQWTAREKARRNAEEKANRDAANASAFQKRARDPIEEIDFAARDASEAKNATRLGLKYGLIGGAIAFFIAFNLHLGEGDRNLDIVFAVAAAASVIVAMHVTFKVEIMRPQALGHLALIYLGSGYYLQQAHHWPYKGPTGLVWLGELLGWGFAPGAAAAVIGVPLFFSRRTRPYWLTAAVLIAALVYLNLYSGIKATRIIAARQVPVASSQAAPEAVAPPATAPVVGRSEDLQEYHRRLSAFESQYPHLNPDSPAFNEAETLRVASALQAYQKRGFTQADSLSLAVGDYARSLKANAGRVKVEPE